MSYSWSTGDTTARDTFFESGTYWLAVTDTNGCSASDTFKVSIYDNPMLMISDTSQCEGTITIDAGSFASYRWTGGETTQTVTFSNSNISQVYVTDSNGCTTADTIQIDIYRNPTLDISDTAQCAGTVVLDAGTHSSYAWSTGATSSQETFNTSGDYTLTVTNTDGCTTIDSFRVDIHDLPTLMLTDTFICPGDTAVIDAGDFASYAWGIGVSTRTISLSSSTLGNYLVTVTDSNGCEATDIVTVSGYPQSSITLGNDTALCGDSIVLNVSTYKDLATSYTWSTGDTADLVVFNQSGLYWLEVTDTNGCYARDTVNLSLNSPPNIPVIQRVSDTLYTNSGWIHQWYRDGVLLPETDSVLPNIVAGSYSAIVIDSNGCTSDSSNLLVYTAGVEGVLAAGKIIAYPNPTSGGVMVELDGITWNTVLEMKLYNLQGQELNFDKIVQGDRVQLEWDIAPQPIWLMIQTTSGTFKKLLIER